MQRRTSRGVFDNGVGLRNNGGRKGIALKNGSVKSWKRHLPYPRKAVNKIKKEK